LVSDAERQRLGLEIHGFLKKNGFRIVKEKLEAPK
jgi:hypothetical protein